MVIKDKVQVIPIGDASQKDDYAKIKEKTLGEVFVMHRIPPALAAMIPTNTGGFGDVMKIDRLYYENEIRPMQQIMQEINVIYPAMRG